MSKTHQPTKPPQVKPLASFASLNGIDQLFVFAVDDRVYNARAHHDGTVSMELSRVPLDVALLLLQGVQSQCSASSK